MKNEIHNKEEHEEHIYPNDVNREMLELYTMLPPFPFRKKQLISKSPKKSLNKNNPEKSEF